jgi:hypothetical protein
VGVGGYTLPANGEKVSFRLDDAIDVARATLTIDDTIRVDRIIVQGQRIRSMFHLSHRDGTLEKAWTSGEETAYESGADSLWAEKNDAARAADEFHRVFQMFRIPASWDWMMHTGVSGASNANPALTKDGALQAGTKGSHWNAGRAFERELPIEKTGLASDREPEYQPPIALAYVTIRTPTGGTESIWVPIHKPGVDDLHPGYLRMVDREQAIEIQTSPNHTLALNHWSSIAGATQWAPVTDWQDIRVCVCARTDTRVKVEARTGEDSGDTASTSERTKVIQVDDAELWYVVPGTVYGVDNGNPITHNGGVVRDDTPRLRAIAAFAKAWYGQDRASITLTLQAKVYAGLPVLSYVKDASSSTQRKDVGTVVTSRSWNFVNRTTTIRTQHAEIDFAGMG